MAVADAVSPRSWKRLSIWIALLVLAAVAAWSGSVMHRQLDRSLRAELEFVLAANVELARALWPRPNAASTPIDSAAAAQRYGQALSKLPVLAGIGRTGEAYAFDREGVMVAPGRFAAEVRAAKLMSWRDGREVIELRDPGGPVRHGHAPKLPRGQQPLTKMAASATSGKSGVDVAGYRDYRGVQVVGAWQWLPEYDLGIAVEIDAAEALVLNEGLREALYALYVAMAFALLAVGGSTRLYQSARRNIDHAKQLGQYTLVREIGRGGMGAVYEARHAFLRRPTAVKLMAPPLDDQVASAEAVLRFEREAQLTSQLSHPNTVVIYDYGRTADGTFYYAMEYVDGVDLEKLVRIAGPLPASRIIHLALQVCGSLTEAHEKSLIHRDIKPANILVCDRGGVFDCVKVLDFGLVKSLLGGPQVSAAHVLVGTPQFMAPEVLRDPASADPKSDIYALGAVLYWLATGHTIWESDVVPPSLPSKSKVVPPSTLRPDLPLDLERVIMRCLSPLPLERPLSMIELANELRACRAHGSWTAHDARRYWREHGTELANVGLCAPHLPTAAAR